MDNILVNLLNNLINNYKDIIKIDYLDTSATCYTEDGYIYLNKDVFDNLIIDDDLSKQNNIFNIMKSIYHEERHLMEEKETKDGICNNSVYFYIICNLINEYYDKDDYTRNYYYQELEIDDNIYGYSKVKELLIKNNINSSIIEKLDNKILEFNNYLLFNQRINKDNIKEVSYDYIPRILNIIIKGNPLLLKKYPQLSLFYLDNGDDKDIYTIIEEEKVLKFYNDSDIFFGQMLLNKILEFDVKRIDNKFIELFNKFNEYFTINSNIYGDSDSVIFIRNFNNKVKEKLEYINSECKQV